MVILSGKLSSWWHYFLPTASIYYKLAQSYNRRIFILGFLGPRGPLIEPPSVHPSVHPSATIFPELIDELKHCRQASGTPQTIHFLKAHNVSYRETTTKTNTETNTKTETNEGRSCDTYGVIYFWKGDDKRILSIISFRQGLRKYKDKYKNNIQNYVWCYMFLERWWR